MPFCLFLVLFCSLLYQRLNASLQLLKAAHFQFFCLRWSGGLAFLWFVFNNLELEYMINTLVFDYGGIIVNMDWHLLRNALSEVGVSSFKSFLYRKKIKTLMNRYINGLEPDDAVMDDILAICRPGTTVARVNALICTLCGNIPASRLEALVRLRSMYKVYLLSNINSFLWEQCLAKMKALGYNVDDCFDQVFLSYKMGVAKPGLQIYRMVESATGLVPQNTLYFDDNADNCAAGKRLNYRTIHVRENRLEDYWNLIPEFRTVVGDRL